MGAVPVKTGGVRVTKSVDHHEELIEQELRKGHVDVERVKMSRQVEGPQEPYRTGHTLVIPVTSEVLAGGGKHWEITEEIRLTQREDSESVQQRVNLAQEHATVERLDARGNVVAAESEAQAPRRKRRLGNDSILAKKNEESAPPNRVLSSRKSILRERSRPKP